MATAPDTAQELLEIILELGIPRICKTYRRPPLPTRLLRELYAIGGQPEARRFIAAYPLSPSDLLETLSSECTDPEALAAAAVNPRTPAHLLSRLIESPLPKVRVEAAGNPQLSARDMRLLARDIDRSVRMAVAANPSLKPQHMAELAQDGEPAVRAALALHPNLLSEIRLVLQADPSPVVAAELVLHDEDEEALLFAADSDNENRQLALLARKDLPKAVGQSLLHSAHPAIRARARERFSPSPAECLGIARRGTVAERLWLASREDLPSPLQRLLSQDESPEVRRRLARHPRVHPDIAAHFVTMHDTGPCEALAANPATPPDSLLALAQSGIESVPPLLAYRSDLPAAVCAYLLKQAPSEVFLRHLASAKPPPPAIPRALLAPYAGHPLPTVRAFVAARGQLDTGQRAQLRKDPVAAVREAICRNPDTTDLELEELLDDPDHSVSETARTRWQSNRRAHREHADPPTGSTENTFIEEPPDSSSTEDPDNTSGVLRRIKRIFV